MICVAFGATAFGQTAQITGRISDQGGAVIQSAKVTVTNEGNGFKRETSSNDEGYFTVPSLLPGSYQVSIQKEGFKPILQTGLVLQVEKVARLDFTLQTGTVTDTIEVQSGAVALDSETASIGQIVSQRQVTQLPLNGRSFLSLLFLNGGTVETNGEQGAMRQGAGSAISINGARPTSNNYLLDGTSNTDTALGTPAAILSIDAIQEFKEQTGTYSAEYGFSANQVNIVSKTGTNDLHGSVFWFGRNDAFDANNFFNNARGVKKTKLRQNQYGFVAGGPVWIPKLYNGRNKSFWLANFEGYKRTLGFSDLLTIPTPDQLAGRFTTEIIDPVTGRPFPNKTVPQNRFSRVARLATAKFFPAPNFTGASGNYLRNRNLPLDQNQYTIRGDQQLGRFGSVYGRFTNSDYTNTSAGNTTELGDRFFIQKTRNWQVSHTMPLGASLVNQFRLGYIEARADENGPAAPQSDIDALQLTGVFTGIPDVQRTYPAVGFAGVGAGLSGGGSAVNDYTTSFQPMWDISNTTTWIRGNHTLNFGANFRKWSLQRDLANDFLGQFTFSGFFTGNRTRDHAIADFLLGYFSGASVFQPAGFSVQGKVGNPRQFNFWYLNAQVTNPFADLLPGTAINGARVVRSQLLRPFPQFTGLTEDRRTIGRAWYNSLQVRLEKRLSQGFHYLVSYTFSKNMEALGYLNAQDAIGQLASVVTGDYAPHRLMISGGYDLPLFKNSSAWLRNIAGGWKANGIAALQSGVPVNTPGGVFLIGDPRLPEGQQSRARWFNTCTLTAAGARQNCASASETPVFQIQPAFTLRSHSTRFSNIRTSRPPQIDLSLFKTFTLREGLALQFRAEAFNFANTPWFGAPNTTATSSAFGVVTPSQNNDQRNVQLALKLVF